MYNNYVNHNKTLANVRLQWSDGKRSSHFPEYLEKPLSEFHNLRTAKLAFELIATRDIEKGKDSLMRECFPGTWGIPNNMLNRRGNFHGLWRRMGGSLARSCE